LNAVVGDTTSFIADNREALGITTDKLSSISQAVVDSLDDIKQTLHVAPTAFQNFINIYQPAQSALSGALAINNFANRSASYAGQFRPHRVWANEQSSKLCVSIPRTHHQERQYNFPPLGENLS